jgi:DNA-binding NtrC family response regulator
VSNGTILVVDDERTLARVIRIFLGEAGYETEVAHDAEAALEMLDRLRPDVVFTDVRLPGMDGIALLRKVREFDPNISVVVMTAFGTIEGAVEAVKLGAFDYIKKPLDLDELKLLADRARENSRLRQELSYYRKQASREVTLAGILGASPAMKAVLDRARQIAALDETPPVLITGETGTGKGLVARTIHSSGPRSGKPFIDVNCTALPATLMEAELFGYERGAFTDAKESKLGLFEAAEGGFLFLDEVGDIELALQGKLLRAIEDRTVRRVGGIRDRKIDVRILAATNRDLEQMAKERQFREDLFFRLNVFPIRLPALRERPGDIAGLVEFFLRKHGAAPDKLTPAALAAFQRHDFPGNVRELENVVERALILAGSDPIDVDHLPFAAAAPAGAPGSRPWIPAIPAEGLSLEVLERELILQALELARGNKSQAARLLGLTRRTLYSRMERHGLRRPGEGEEPVDDDSEANDRAAEGSRG